MSAVPVSLYELEPRWEVRGGGEEVSVGREAGERRVRVVRLPGEAHGVRSVSLSRCTAVCCGSRRRALHKREARGADTRLSLVPPLTQVVTPGSDSSYSTLHRLGLSLSRPPHQRAPFPAPSPSSVSRPPPTPAPPPDPLDNARRVTGLDELPTWWNIAAREERDWPATRHGRVMTAGGPGGPATRVASSGGEPEGRGGRARRRGGAYTHR